MIIGANGAIHAGKDSVGEYLKRTRGYEIVRFSDAIVVEVSMLYKATIDAYLREHHRLPDDLPITQELYDQALIHHRTSVTRAILQDHGTMRRRENYAYWLDKVNQRLLDLTSQHKCVAVAGVRYENEVALIKRWGGMVVKVEREQRPHNQGAHADSHEVEHGLDRFTGFDHVIHNNGTIEEFEARLEEWMKVVEAIPKNRP